MNIRKVVLIILAAGLAGCVSFEARQIQTHREGLQPMLGRSETEVLELVTRTWNYGLIDRWEAENPDVETVLRKSFRTLGFSRKEAEKIFTAPGAYRVLTFTKPLSREVLTTGSIDSLGGGVIGSSDRNVSAVNGYVRIVIRDGKLADFRVGT